MGDALPRVLLGTGRKARQVGCGGQHACARLDDGTVKCWGDSLNGQLGLGDKVVRGDGPGEMGDALPAVARGTGRTAVDLRVGFSHACARLDDGALKCWGYNDAGALGVGDKIDRGTAPGQMGDALPAVDLGTGRSAIAVTLGINHSCALLDDATVKRWGGNNSGQLGLGDTMGRGGAPSHIPIAGHFFSRRGAEETPPSPRPSSRPRPPIGRGSASFTDSRRAVVQRRVAGALRTIGTPGV